MMKRKQALRFLEAVIFCAVLFAVVAFVSQLAERKMSKIRMKPFLDRAKEYDVLFVGDSHMVNAVYPMELWQDYGITAYNIASYGNTLPVSYWTMVNALDYARPRLVVLGIKDVDKDHKLTGSSSDVHTAFDCYPLSLNKIRAIEDLMDDPEAMDDEGNSYAEMKWEYYFTLGKYHARWDELSLSDLRYETNVLKGGDMAISVARPDDYDLIDEDRAADEQGCGYAYLRRTIEECQARGIDVLLTHLPYPSDPDDQMAANTVSAIAEEYGVGFVDFVSLDQVVDYETDCYDSDSHLNPSGAQKVTDYLGQYIVDHYDVEDRRGDTAYAQWQADWDAYMDHKVKQLAGQEELHNLLMLLHDDSLSVSISIREQAELYWDDQALTLLHNIAREHIFEADAYSKWSNSLFPLTGLEDAVWADEAYFLELDRAGGSMAEYTGEAASEQHARVFGGWEEGKEIQILVTDSLTGEVAVNRQL